MLKLLKYEFRKAAFSKAILLLVTAAAEILYLIGVFGKNQNALGYGCVGLVLCATIGIFYVGIESLLVFHKDLNTKQSYMLFLMPRNSYQILGAKVLENAISIFFTGLFFALVAAADITIGVLYIGGIKEFMNLIQEIARIQIDWDVTAQTAAMGLTAGLTSWFLTIVTGDLAIVLSATVLAGKRFSGLVSFVIFMIINCAYAAVINYLPEIDNSMVEFYVTMGVTLAITALLYMIAGNIMEKKLSV